MSESKRDRAVGSLLGLAVGDALGTTLEFTRRDSLPPLTDMVGGGPFDLEPGEWTDDTSMALCLAESLLANGELDQLDLMRRFVRWWRKGENSSNGRCFDIGNATRAALYRFEETGNPRAGSTDPRAAGNGSLMRLSPAIIRHHLDRAKSVETARRQSETTHAAPSALAACALFAEMLFDAIDGVPHADLFAQQREALASEIANIAKGAYKRRQRDEIRSSGYVVHTLEAALWSVFRSSDFREAVLLAVNLADDSDTVGAVTGQLAGAIWGASDMPEKWRSKIVASDRIVSLAERLFEAGDKTGLVT